MLFGRPHFSAASKLENGRHHRFRHSAQGGSGIGFQARS